MLRYRERIAAQARIFKALGHPSRLLIADALRSGEKCVGDLQALVGGDISTVSRHLSVLREAGIVTSEKRRTSIYYSLAIRCLDSFLACTGDMLTKRSLLTDPERIRPHPGNEPGGVEKYGHKPG